MSASEGNADLDLYIGQRRRRRVLASALVLLAALVLAAVVLASRAFEIQVAPERAADSFSWEQTRGLLLPLGRRVVLLSEEGAARIAADGFAPKEVAFSRSDPHRRIEVRLQPLPGQVTLAVTSSEAFELFLNEQLLGSAPEAQVELPPGPHAVRIQGPQIQPVEEQIQVAGHGQAQRFQFATTLANSRLAVAVAPAEAQLFLDGAPLAKGSYRGPVSLGAHQLRAAMDGYRDRSIEFRAAADQLTDLGAIQLQPKNATLAIESRPPGAAVLVDGQFVGSAPVQVSLAALQTHRLALRKPGHQVLETELRPAPGERIDRTFSLDEQTYQAEVVADLPAQVRLNGIAKGETPLSLKVREGDRIQVERDGYQTQSASVGPVGGPARRYAFRMLRPKEYAYQQAAAELVLPEGLRLRKFPPARLRLPPPLARPGDPLPGDGAELILTRPFYLGASEVTYQAFSAFRAKPVPPGLTSRHPVANLSWLEAAQFCNWLSDRHGLPPVYAFNAQGELQQMHASALGFRLPTEAEWNAAARHDFQRRRTVDPYPWGETEAIPQAYANFAGRELQGQSAQFLQSHKDNHPGLAEAGAYPANFNGLHDLAGNLSEWVQDYYQAIWPGAETLTDPLGPVHGLDHVLKGANYRSHRLAALRSDHRQFGSAGSELVGFRIARWIH